MTTMRFALKYEVLSHPQVFLERLQPSPFLKGGEYPWAQSILNPNILPGDNGVVRMFIRGVAARPEGFNHGNYISSIGYCESKNGFHFTLSPEPIIVPTESYENALGCEDPLGIKLELDEADKAALKDEPGVNPDAGNLFLLYYVAVGGKGRGDRDIRVALAASQDLKHWNKYGVVGPTTEITKSGLVLPKKDSLGRFVMLYTAWTESPRSSIMIARFDSVKDLLHPPLGFMDENLRNYRENLFLGPSSPFLNKGPETGAGAVPLNDELSILVISPENRKMTDAWDIAALLLDRDANILAYIDLPVSGGLQPEDRGIICADCTFPRGATIRQENGQKMFYISVGTGDDGAALFRVSLDELLAGFEQDLIINGQDPRIISQYYLRKLRAPAQNRQPSPQPR